MKRLLINCVCDAYGAKMYLVKYTFGSIYLYETNKTSLKKTVFVGKLKKWFSPPYIFWKLTKMLAAA